MNDRSFYLGGTLTDTAELGSESPAGVDWEAAGRGWGARALEWAYLFESYARPANGMLLDQLAVGDGTRMLDVACGAGLAANTASRRGASVAGLDASADLIDIASRRTPAGDFRVGDMFALPFDDDGFDVVTSFNGIWNGGEAALHEVRRVLVDGGRFGMTFWGRYERLGLMPYFLKVIELSPSSHQSATREQGETRLVVEDMLRATSFEIRDQGTVEVTNEWPDVGTAVARTRGGRPLGTGHRSGRLRHVLPRAGRGHHATPRRAHRGAHHLRARLGDHRADLTAPRDSSAHSSPGAGVAANAGAAAVCALSSASRARSGTVRDRRA